MKIEVKPKIVVRFLLIFWTCFFTIWFFFKKLPEIREKNIVKDLVQNSIVSKNNVIKETNLIGRFIFKV